MYIFKYFSVISFQEKISLRFYGLRWIFLMHKQICLFLFIYFISETGVIRFIVLKDSKV